MVRGMICAENTAQKKKEQEETRMNIPENILSTLTDEQKQKVKAAKTPEELLSLAKENSEKHVAAITRRAEIREKEKEEYREMVFLSKMKDAEGYLDTARRSIIKRYLNSYTGKWVAHLFDTEGVFYVVAVIKVSVYSQDITRKIFYSSKSGSITSNIQSAERFASEEDAKKRIEEIHAKHKYYVCDAIEVDLEGAAGAAQIDQAIAENAI